MFYRCVIGKQYIYKENGCDVWHMTAWPQWLKAGLLPTFFFLPPVHLINFVLHSSIGITALSFIRWNCLEVIIKFGSIYEEKYVYIYIYIFHAIIHMASFSFQHTWLIYILYIHDFFPRRAPRQVSVLQHRVDNEAQLLESEYLGNQEKKEMFYAHILLKRLEKQSSQINLKNI